ncbi:type II toxin-antitoxin system RelE/ParE family toxin [Pseudomonas sp. NFACC45]|uniref:type II toxin-antitoxin system RelE/ParE family toxin n=1 Tax=Pseudomonas sp. NFACC45 TaxID=1566201 RepID=UPI0008E25086|nr:type II toxin-antitoxin system RelE/ParE family toxin [Pseudomonas sp. NFACC45]SFH04471.1 Plasmid stabilization system protein ParE [Pseudomonas sp. NFACC45]
MRVEWLEKALKKPSETLEDEASYIALENPKAADDFSDAIFASVDKLARFPAMGREGRVKNTREWAVPNWSYLIPYRVRGDRLQILGVFHTRQRPRAKG